MSKVFLFKMPKIITAVFPGGPKRVNPTMTTNTVTATRKGDPQHYVEGKIKCTQNNISFALDTKIH